MAKLVFTNAYVSVAGTDLSDHVAQVVWTETAAEVGSTAFGTGYEERLGGLKSASVQLQFHQDFAAASVHATIGGLLGGTAAVIVRPNGSSAGTANPGRTGVFLVSTLTPIGGAVGDLLTQDITWNSTGTFGTA
jgi:hypothetical protein